MIVANEVDLILERHYKVTGNSELDFALGLSSVLTLVDEVTAILGIISLLEDKHIAVLC
jgi:hypothetical protein